MTHTLYPRLAWQGITKNKRLYLPFLLTCVGMVMMTYILLSLASSPVLKTFPGGDVMPMILSMGSFVMAAFAVLFLFYTNSFLIRRRNREFGLYNILGMGKGNLARVLAWESVMMALVAIVGGEALGIALGKLFELVLVNIVGGSVQMDFTVSVPATAMTAILYLGIFALLFLRSLVTVCRTNAAALLRSESYGEKPPKANWAFGLAGFGILGAAYYIAVTIKQPLTALAVFFIAVLMVIVGTYLIFISGSVLLCRTLQKNKRYYYQKNHFISVSSMAYRMKRNGAGLASVCILATMVLVMLSSTTCLYFGTEDALRTRYPQDFSIELRFTKDEGGANEENIRIARGMVESVIEQDKLDVQEQFDTRSAWFSGLLTGNSFERADRSTLMDYERAVDMVILPLEDYTRMTGESLTLGPGEAYFCCPRMAYTQSELHIGELSYQIKGQLPDFGGFGADSANITTTFYLVVPDFDAAIDALQTQDTRYPVVISWQYSFDSGSPDKEQIVFLTDMLAAFAENKDGLAYASYTVESLAFNRDDFQGTYGSLFFLGIILAYWFAVDYPRMVRELVCVVGPERGRDVTLILAVLSRSTGGYMRGTLITSIADGLMVAVGLVLVGHPYAGLVGALTFVMHFIPVIGPMLSAVAGTLLGLFVSPACALWTLVIAMVAQNVADNLLSPMVMRSAVKIHPALSLVGIIVGGCLGGPVGMVIAVPVTAALRGFFVYFFETRTGRQIVSEDGALFWSRPYVDGKGDPIPALDALDDERFFEGSRLSFSPDVLSERDAPKNDGGEAR